MIKRYYNGVASPRTTICCSALALTMAGVGRRDATPRQPEPPALFPLRPVRTLALTSALAVPPAFNGARGYFPIEGDRLAAYDLDTGEELWMMPARTQSRPAAGEGLVFIAEPEALAALREADGSEAWRLPLTERLAAPLVWDNGWLIAATASGTLLALRGARRRADLAVVTSARLLSAPPALAADRVYAPAKDGRIVALRIDTGEPLWERRIGGSPSEMLALDDRLYVGSDDNFFYCLTARTGQIDWRWRTGGDVVGAAVVDERRVYFVSFDNILRALDRRSGAQRWKRPLPFRPLTGALMAGATVIASGVAPPLRAFLTKDGAPGGEVDARGRGRGAAPTSSPVHACRCSSWSHAKSPRARRSRFLPATSNRPSYRSRLCRISCRWGRRRSRGDVPKPERLCRSRGGPKPRLCRSRGSSHLRSPETCRRRQPLRRERKVTEV